MAASNVRGKARFVNGKLVLPSAIRNQRKKNQKSLFSAEKKTRKPIQASEEQGLDLNSWREENPEDWGKLKKKIDKEKTERLSK